MAKRPVSGDPGPGASGARFADGLTDDLRLCFGTNFRAARERAGLKQSDIEARTGIKQHYVSQIENGRQNPTLGTLSVLAASVGLNVGAMLQPVPRPSARGAAADDKD